jgi:hypothetical protein
MLVFNWKQPEPRKQVRFHCRELMTTADPIGFGQAILQGNPSEN